MKENFLQRWSRLKRDPPTPAAATPPTPQAGAGGAPAAPATPALPALDSLEFSSDFTAFMADEVEDGLRRVALQKLFHAGHFNVMDGLDVYIDDYNSFEPIGEEMLNNLNQARGLLFDDEKAAPGAAETTPGESASPRIDADQPDEPVAGKDIVMEKNK